MNRLSWIMMKTLSLIIMVVANNNNNNSAASSSSLDETRECPFEDFHPCLQLLQGQYLSAKSIWSCCEILNQAIIQDHHCFCITPPSLLLTMSDCLISIPQCHEEQVRGDEAGFDWEAASSSYQNLKDGSPPPANNATASSSSVVAPVLGVLTSSAGSHTDHGIIWFTLLLHAPCIYLLASSLYT
ncbi:unnamed protein product [Cuscuta epithymum]|uniref:Bifunctional inhibitor/plant lipid transfer protein/seed storage helical domain-containing protein n=1 Tax=Cuscuta epithymum TaxID=186058 RepID=A0AAV0D7N9_9ASTE|nr:unnamed protein product [Cuscuta epithymum]